MARGKAMGLDRTLATSNDGSWGMQDNLNIFLDLPNVFFRDASNLL